MADLGGRVVAFLEGRRAAELADLIQRHNGRPLAAPTLREVHQPDAPELQGGVRAACEADVALFVFLTGVGTRTVFDAVRHASLEQPWRSRLDAAAVAVRGPKPTAVLREEGIRIDIMAPPPNTTAELLQALEQVELNGRTVTVQLYGAPNPELSQALAQRGAHVIELAPYVWDRPVDPAPVLRVLAALDRSEVDALLITSQAQVENLFLIAADNGLLPRLEGVAIGAQGPIAAAALERRGVRVDFMPERGHMGALVLAAAAHFSSASDRATSDGAPPIHVASRN